MKNDPHLYLTHILESIEWIEKDIAGLTFEQFLSNVPIQDAVIRRLEIIGEATRNLPSELKLTHPEIKWAEIAGMRNVLIHEYFGVNVERVWETVQQDIPHLKNAVQRLLELQTA